MKLLFLADPIARLNPKGDSSLAMLRAALKRGDEVFWATDRDLELSVDELLVDATSISSCEKDGLPVTAKTTRVPLKTFDACFIRKDPPFDSGYVRLCRILSLVENDVFMLNKPSLLLRHHEKMLPFEAKWAGFLLTDDLIPTHVGSFEESKRFLEKGKWEKVIAKPFFGHGGEDIKLLTNKELDQIPREDTMVQPYQDEVTKTGDRRVFFLNGDVLAHFARMPKPGGFVSNLAQGGSAAAIPLSEKEKGSLDRLGKFLRSVGIVLAGADVIGGKISEVNVTSPTGLRSLETLDGKDYAVPILEFVEKNLKRGGLSNKR